MNAPATNTMELQAAPRITGHGPGSTSGATQQQPKAKSREDAEEKISRDYYGRNELLEAIKKDRKLRVNSSFDARYQSFWDALEKAFIDFEIRKSKKDANLYAMPAIFHTAVKNIHMVTSEPNHASFSTYNGMIEVINGGIQFIPAIDTRKSTDKKVVLKPLTYNDVFNAIAVAAASGYKSLSIEGGTHHERAMYKRGILAYNASVPENLRFKLDKGFPLDLMDKLPHASIEKLFTDYMHRANAEEKPAPKKKTSTPKKKPESTKVDTKGDTKTEKFASAAKGTAQTPKNTDEKDKDKTAPDPKTGKSPDECKAYLEKHWKEAGKYGLAFKTPDPYDAYELDVVENGEVPRTIYFVNHPSDPCRIIYIHEKDGSDCYRDNEIFLGKDLDHPAHPAHRSGKAQAPTPSAPA